MRKKTIDLIIARSESNGTDLNVPENSSSSLSNETDHHHHQQQRKLNHSDSLYLLRKKVHTDQDNTSEDESQLSSIIESSEQATLFEGV